MQATPASVPSFEFTIGVKYQLLLAGYFSTGEMIEPGLEDSIEISGAFSDDFDWDADSDENDEDKTEQQNEDSSISRNAGTIPQSHHNHKFQCSATFCWRGYRAYFICFYSPYQHAFFNFQLSRFPFEKKVADEMEIGWPWCMNLEMKEDLGPGAISIQQHVIIPPMYLGGRASNTDQVRDDAGKLMISARLDLGVSRNPLWLWGKEVKDGEDSSMSTDEKMRIAEFQRRVEQHDLLVGGHQSLGVYEGEGF